MITIPQALHLLSFVPLIKNGIKIIINYTEIVLPSQQTDSPFKYLTTPSSAQNESLNVKKKMSWKMK